MKTDSYLGQLIRKVTGADAVAVETLQVADTSVLQAEFEAYKLDAIAQHTELSAALEAAMATIAQADAEKTALEAKLAEAQAAATEALEAKQALAAAAEAQRVALRKEKIVAAVGTARADATFDAIGALPDAHFEIVLDGYKVAGDVEGRSKFFTHQGADVEVEAALVTNGESAEMKILKSMFPPVA